MEIELRTSDGIGFRITGTSDELDSATEFIARHGANILAVARGTSAGSGKPVHNGSGSPQSGSRKDLQDALESRGASTDIERLAVMAQFAVDHGEPGLTAELAQQWYTELGIPKPAVWRSTFANTRRRGLIHSTAVGWLPTTAGENYARHGIKRGPQKRRTTRRRDEG